MEATIISVSGKEEKFDLSEILVARADVKQDELNHASELALSIANAYSQIVKGYSSLCPFVAQAISAKIHTQFVGIKSMNQLVMAVTGCSKATASEIVKVSSTFYTEQGKLIKGYEMFTYSELIALSGVSESVREDVRLQIAELNCHTRKDVKNAIEKINKQRQAEIEEKVSEADAKEKAKAGAKADSIDTIADTKADSTDTSADTKSDSTDSKADTKVDSTDTKAESAGSTVEPTEYGFTSINTTPGIIEMSNSYLKTIQDLEATLARAKKNNPLYTELATIIEIARAQYSTAAEQLINNMVNIPTIK